MFKNEHTKYTYLMHATAALLVLAEGGKCSLRNSCGDIIAGFASIIAANVLLKKEYERCNVHRCS
jgi:hypothetical protein